MILNAQLRAEILESAVIELFSVVGDKHPRDPEPAYDAFPYESPDVLLCDSGEGFYLNPFREVIDADYKELQLP